MAATRNLGTVLFLFTLAAGLAGVQSKAMASGRLAPPEEQLQGGSLEPPPLGSSSTNIPRNAQVMDQSAFALGTMVWNVIFVQGDGSIQTQRETWTPSEIANIQSKISGAESYWEGMTAGFNPAARLAINVNYVNGGSPMITGYEPSTDQSEVWINSVMNQLGYNNSSRFTNVRNFNQAQRNANNTNWATTILVLDNTSAYLTSYAYAYYGGPFTILENDSAGWGPQNFNMVLSHEMGHIFFANDEYYASGARVTDHGGYLNVANTNAERDAAGNRITPPQLNALMLNNGNYNTHVAFSPSVPSSQMFGFRDTDADNIPDILDTPASLTGSNAGSNPNTGFFAFAGNIQVTQLANLDPLNVGFSNSQSAMTIDTIISACYRLDSGMPVSLPAGDGSYGGYDESLSFTIAGLPYGLHAIDVYGFNSVGNSSNTLHYSFNVVPEPATLCLLAMSGLAVIRRRRK